MMVVRKNACSRHQLTRRQAHQLANREKGYYLVEALVCCLIIGIMSAGLAQGYAKIRAFNTHAQVRLQASQLAQECVDQLRCQQFNLIVANLGTHNVPITGATPTGDVLFPRPLLRDTGLNYAANDAVNYVHTVNDQAVVTLTNIGNNTIDVNVSVIWNDGQGHHTYVTDTILVAGGLNG
jgi:type II secretory pathway pseudopilin PulG